MHMLEKLINNKAMLEAANVIKIACELKQFSKNKCKGCPFNRLTNGQGEYSDRDWSDEDDRNYNNYTYCELYFGEEQRPAYWDIEVLRKYIQEK